MIVSADKIRNLTLHSLSNTLNLSIQLICWKFWWCSLSHAGYRGSNFQQWLSLRIKWAQRWSSSVESWITPWAWEWGDSVSTLVIWLWPSRFLFLWPLPPSSIICLHSKSAFLRAKPNQIGSVGDPIPTIISVQCFLPMFSKTCYLHDILRLIQEVATYYRQTHRKHYYNPNCEWLNSLTNMWTINDAKDCLFPL